MSADNDTHRSGAHAARTNAAEPDAALGPVSADTTATEPVSDDRLQDGDGGSSLTTAHSTDADGSGRRWSGALQSVLNGSVLVTVLAVVLALVACGILIAVTDPDVQAAAGYFFARPGDTFAAIGHSVGGSYLSLFEGSIYNPARPGFANQIVPLTQTVSYAVPLITAGLGVAVSFRAGLFNIGGQGQILMGAAAAGWVGINLQLPAIVHIPLAIIAGIAGGAIWAGIVGVLKARTGAHEVIVTIMLNYVALYLLSYMLRTQGLLQAPGSANPESAATRNSAILPDLFGPRYGIDLGFIVAIVAVIVVWWLMTRSTLGFKFRTVGENPRAARVAGMSVPSLTIWSLVISGALVGIAGSYQVQGALTTGFTSNIDAGIGFDAITVALLGRSRPWGVFWAALLFGALKSGGYAMQAANAVPIDIVDVIQALIVLFIAAPPLVRAIFRIPQPGTRRRTKRSAPDRKAVAA